MQSNVGSGLSDTSRQPPWGIQSFLNETPLHSRQIMIVTVCGLCLFLDGFDLQALSFAAPALLADWKLERNVMGPIFSAALLGVLLGSLSFGLMADRVGRRPTILWATVLFTLATFATAFVNDTTELALARLITGIGLGGVISNALVMASEFSPLRKRSMLVLFASCGLPLGGMCAGAVATAFLPDIGWRGLFLIGGLIPIPVIVLLWFALPESLAYTAQLDAKDGKGRTAAMLEKIIPGFRNDEFKLPEAAPHSPTSPLDLLRGGRARVTILLCLVNFLAQLDVYFLANWLPTVLLNAGLTGKAAIIAGTVLQLGAVVGALVLGVLSIRIGFRIIISLVFTVATAAVYCLGQPWMTLNLIFAATFITGFCVVGAQPAVYAWATALYPTGIRGTGLGWTIGIGRAGSVIGPSLGGTLLSLGWGNESLFIAAALPALAVALLAPFISKDNRVV